MFNEVESNASQFRLVNWRISPRCLQLLLVTVKLKFLHQALYAEVLSASEVLVIGPGKGWFGECYAKGSMSTQREILIDFNFKVLVYCSKIVLLAII